MKENVSRENISTFISTWTVLEPFKSNRLFKSGEVVKESVVIAVIEWATSGQWGVCTTALDMTLKEGKHWLEDTWRHNLTVWHSV